MIVGRTPRPGVDSGTMWCTRAWWTMHHFGVDCGILLGGVERWEAEGRPLASGPSGGALGVPAPPLVPAGGWERAKADRNDVLAVVQGGGACLVDALNTESYEGREANYGRPGHIPGAVNTPYLDLIERETCGFVDADAMAATLRQALDAERVVTYCGGAIAATVPAFCLALLGYDAVSVYDGSLLEWANDPDLPMVGPSDG